MQNEKMTSALALKGLWSKLLSNVNYNGSFATKSNSDSNINNSVENEFSPWNTCGSYGMGDIDEGHTDTPQSRTETSTSASENDPDIYDFSSALTWLTAGFVYHIIHRSTYPQFYHSSLCHCSLQCCIPHSPLLF